MELLQIGRIALIFISWLGYFRILSKKSEVNILFAPMIVMSSQMLILFLAGILNMMKAAVLLLFLFGLLLFIMQIIKEGFKAFFSSFANAGFVFFAIVSVAFYIAIYNAKIIHYDDFSHWALIVKQMLIDDRYPNFENVIMFQAYPPGGATFIYYFCSLSGGGEGLWIYAQGLLELAYILPLFVLCDNKNSLLRIAYCLLFTNFVMCTMHLHQGLLVDILLAVVGAGSMFFVWYCCRKSSIETPNKTLIYTIPLLSACILIKNSGILFAALCSVYMLVKMRKSYKTKYLLVAMVPYLIIPIWNKHCDLVYENAALTKHALSFEYMRLIFNEKTPDYLFWILKKVILFSLQGKELFLVLLMFVITALVVYLCAPDLKKAYFKAILFCAFFYTIYEFGLYLVYVFSMTVDQGLALAGSERYRRTALIILLYVPAVFTMFSFSRANWKKPKSLAGFLAAFLVLLGVWKIDAGNFYTILRTSNNQLRDQMESMISDYNVPSGTSGFVCSYPNGYAGMEFYIYPYLTLSTDFNVVYNADEEILAEAMDYNFLFILDENNPAIEDFVTTNFPDQLGKAVIDMREQDNT